MHTLSECGCPLVFCLPDFPPGNNTSPSFLADLKVELVPEGERYKLNISWAISIDGMRQHFVFFSTWKLRKQEFSDMTFTELIIK